MQYHIDHNILLQIMLIDNGNIIEYDTPNNLLNNKNK